MDSTRNEDDSCLSSTAAAAVASESNGNPSLKIKTKKHMLDDEEALDGFSADENTTSRCVEDEYDEANSCSENRVSFHLKETEAESTTEFTVKPAKKQKKRRGSAFLFDQAIASNISASQLFVYKWPQNGPTYELYILQEQVSDCLGIKSFKRKYPDLYRRAIEINERVYLKENNVVSETQCDLGLTALRLDDVLDIMAQEYPEKYHEFNYSLNEKRKSIMASQIEKKRSETAKSTKLPEGLQMKELIQRAVKSAAAYNSNLQKEKKEERSTFFDLHTMRIQVPKNKTFQLSSEYTKTGAYPVPLIDGQYHDYYKEYTSEELKYLPLNTILYTLPKPTELLYSEWKHDPKLLDPNSSDEDSDIVETFKSVQRSVESPKPPQSKPESIISATCYVCQKSSTSDKLISCSSCQNYSHPSCLELNPSLVSWNCIRNYNWQCMECKICSKCQQSNDEDKMMFCDRCDRGYHTYCVGVKEVPSGSWLCLTCKTTENSKLTPVKVKVNAIFSASSPNVTPAKRGRPVGSLNKPKFGQDSPDNGSKKSRGRPKKIRLDNQDSKDNSQVDTDDENSLNTNSYVIDENLGNHFYALNN